MILEELIATFVSLSSTLFTNPPPVSRVNQSSEYSMNEQDYEEKVSKRIVHREYNEQEDVDRSTKESTICTPLLQNGRSQNRTVFRSILKSLEANIKLLFGVFALGFFNITLGIANFSTTSSCIAWKHYNHSVPNSVKLLNTVGTALTSYPIYNWFPLSMVALFGWKEFKANYLPCLSLGFLAACISMAYKSILGKEAYMTIAAYRALDYIFFFSTLLIGVAIVTTKYRTFNPGVSYSFARIFLALSFPYLAACVFSYIFTFVIIKKFNEASGRIKAITAALSPSFAVVPLAFAKYLIRKKTWKIIPIDRAFVLCFFLKAGVIMLFRTMQADFENIWIFIGLSMLHGVSSVFTKATLNLRIKLWKYFITKCVNRTPCGSRIRVVPLNTPRVRRLYTDLEIQYVLLQYATAILGQGYLTLYLVLNYEVDSWQVIQYALMRIAISLSIDFFFNIISIFIQIHFHDFPLRRVWLKHWRRHLFATVLILTIAISKFSDSLVSVFQTREDNMDTYTLRNCTTAAL